MKQILIATSILSLCECAEENEPAPTVDDEAPAPIAAEDLAPSAEPQSVAATLPEKPAATCAVIDSRNWKAWTAPDGTGTTLHVSGEVDLPTPGYSAILRLGASDRAMPPGQIVHLDLTAPEGLVAQVITATPVAIESPGAYPEYASVTILCGDSSIAVIAPVGAGSQ
jgi:hypothetical protein